MDSISPEILASQANPADVTELVFQLASRMTSLESAFSSIAVSLRELMNRTDAKGRLPGEAGTPQAATQAATHAAQQIEDVKSRVSREAAWDVIKADALRFRVLQATVAVQPQSDGCVCLATPHFLVGGNKTADQLFPHPEDEATATTRLRSVRAYADGVLEDLEREEKIIRLFETPR
jgi:hypothetical protein